MNRIAIITALLFLHSYASGYTLIFGIDEEVKRSKKIGEIIIHNLSYRLNIAPDQPKRTDTIVDEITYSFVEKADSVITYKTKGHAYWPMSIGDTVLSFFTEENEISLLAEKTEDSEYYFWVPYHQWRYNTIIFYANSPFKADSSNQNGSKKLYDHLHIEAQRKGYEYGFLDHCRISTKEFWIYFEKKRH